MPSLSILYTAEATWGHVTNWPTELPVRPANQQSMGCTWSHGPQMYKTDRPSHMKMEMVVRYDLDYERHRISVTVVWLATLHIPLYLPICGRWCYQATIYDLIGGL